MKLKKKLALTTACGLAALLVLPALASAQGVLFVKDDKVGIGTPNPAFPLHVVSTTAGAQTMARFTNNGAPFVFYEDTSSGTIWGLQPTMVGDFTISLSGTFGTEVVIRKTGRVQIGPGPATVFDLSPTGNLTIDGSLMENSSRKAKEGFSPLDGREVLTRVSDLDVLEWSYKDQPVRHIGPMAEDFYDAFGLGGGKDRLAPRDLAGVTLLAVQGLNEIVEEKNQQIDQLSRQVAELRAMVESLASK